jgi:RING finger protein 113A
MKRNLRTVASSGFGAEDTQIVKAKKEEPITPVARKEEEVIIAPLVAQTKQKYNVRFDYSAGLCKDFLETGYCGFGDSCIFLHDRGDYKMSWELDADFEKQQQQNDVINYEVPELVDPSLTECPICKRAHEKPRMLPECSHRFCQSCIVNALKTKLKCPLCKLPVSGSLKPVVLTTQQFKTLPTSQQYKTETTQQ